MINAVQILGLLCAILFTITCTVQAGSKSFEISLKHHHGVHGGVRRDKWSTKSSIVNESIVDALPNSYFYGVVTIGGIDFTVLMDTGSSNLYVPSNCCGCSTSSTAPPACTSEPFQVPSTNCSSTAYPVPSSDSATICQAPLTSTCIRCSTIASCGILCTLLNINCPACPSVPTNFFLQYGSGYACGFVYSDTIQLAGLTVQNAEFGGATYMNQLCGGAGGPASGILGLGYPELAQADVTPLFDYFMDADLLPSNAFTFCLNSYSTSVSSTLTLGAVVNLASDSVVNYTPVSNNAGYWTVNWGGISLGSLTVGKGCSGVVVDTGTSLLYLNNNAEVTSLNQALGATMNSNLGSYAFNCTNVGSLQPVTVNINNIGYTIQPTEYVYNYTDTTTNTKYCISGFQYSSSLCILGNVFLTTRCTVFDRDSNQVGFQQPMRS